MSDPLRQYLFQGTPNLPGQNPNPQPPFMPPMIGGAPPQMVGYPPHPYVNSLPGHMSPIRMPSPPPHMLQQQPSPLPTRPPTDVRSLENLLKQQLGVDTTPTAPTPASFPASPVPSSPLQQSPSPSPPSSTTNLVYPSSTTPPPTSTTPPPQNTTNSPSSASPSLQTRVLGSSGERASPRRKGSSRGTPEKEIGFPISGKDVAYPAGQGNSNTQLPVTPITLLGTPCIYQQGNTIAVNKNYICYTVKGNMIRVINIFSAQRTLIKGHTDQIMDMKFFSINLDILASVGKDGNIFVWRITEAQADSQISQSTLLHIKVQNEDAPVGLDRLVWHPSRQVLATSASDNAAYIWDVEQFIRRAEGAFVVQHDSTTPGVRKIQGTTQVHDLSFSLDGDQLAIAGQDGQVALWDISQADGDPRSVHSWLPHNGSPVTAVLYCGVQDDSPRNEVILTGAMDNSQLRLWDTRSWECLQTLNFQNTPETKEFYNHIILDSPFVIVANSKSTAFYVLHLDYGQRDSAPDSNSAVSEAADTESGIDSEGCSFDYLTEFSVGQPILSITNRPLSDPASQAQMGLYCVQTKAIQMYHVKPELCYPASLSLKKKKRKQRSLVTHSPAKHSAAPTDNVSTTPSEPSLPPENVPPEAHEDTFEPGEEENKGVVEATNDGDNVVDKNGDNMETGRRAGEDAQPREELRDKGTSEGPAGEEKVEGAEKEGGEGTTEGKEKEGERPEEKPVEVGETVEEAKAADSAVLRQLVGAGQAAESESPVDAGPKDDSHEGKDEEDHKPEEPAEVGKEPPSAEVKEDLETEKPPEFLLEEVKPADKEDATIEAGAGEAAPTKPSEEPETEFSRPDVVISPETDQGTPSDTLNKQAPTPTVADNVDLTRPKGHVTKSPNKGSKRDRDSFKKKNKKPTAKNARPETTEAPATPNEKGEPPAVIASPSPNGKSRAKSFSEGSKDIKKELSNLENSIHARMERTIQQHIDRQFARLDKDRHEREKAEREQQQRLLAAISQTLNVTVSQQVEKIIQRELQGSVVPSVQRLVGNMEKNFTKALQEEMKKYVVQVMSNRISALESSMKEIVSAQLAGVLQSAPREGARVDTDNLSERLVMAVRQPVQESFKEYFRDILVPAFEGSCQKMFRQVSQNFEMGIQQTFESVAQRSRELQVEASRGATSEAEAALLGELGHAVHTLVDISANLNNGIIQTQSQVIRQLADLEKRSTEKEKEPPTPIRDPKIELEHLLTEEKYEQAFILALNEKDLNLVTWLCSRIEPRGLFLFHRQALSQVTLLSLMQQLGFDLARDTSLKLTWLTEIAVVLDPKDEIIHAHALGIFETVLRNLHALSSASGHDNPMEASTRRVLMVIIQRALDSGSSTLSHSQSGLPTSASAPAPPPGLHLSGNRY